MEAAILSCFWVLLLTPRPDSPLLRAPLQAAPAEVGAAEDRRALGAPLDGFRLCVFNSELERILF